MGGRASTVEQSRLGEEERAGTDRRGRPAADRGNASSPGVAAGTSMPPATMTVSNVRRLKDAVCTSEPKEVATGPPCSESRVTAYACEPTFQFAVSNTLVAPKLMAENFG
jgi:hypothetical protein